MGHRSIALLFSTLLAFASSGVMALGLGKIKLDSALNQPLRAEIELLEVRDLTEPEILVGLATQEDFQRVGVDKTYFLSDLRFQVIVDRQEGGPKIIITSRKPVREPYLNFVVEAQWPSGKLLREYTLLLDLPVYGDSAPVAIEPSRTAPQQTRQTQTTQSRESEYNPRSSFTPPGGSQSTRPSSSSSSQESYAPSYAGETYSVVANDTLWEIAARVKPNRSVSIQQTMLAIQRYNPEAFINDNINLLKKGQILRIPSSDEISSAFSARSAVAEVAEQNEQWSSSYGGRDVSGAQLSSGRSYDDDDTSSESREGRLKLTSPDDMYSSTEGRGSGVSADASTEALENELAITMEQLDKSSRENNELRSKVEALEEQIQTMEKMIEVSNENMAALEIAAAKNNAADEAAEIQAQSTPESEIEDLYREAEAEIEATDDDLLFEEEEETADTSLAELTPEATPVSTPTATVAPTQTPVATPTPAPAPSLVDTVMQYLPYILGGVVVLGAVAFVFLRRKSDDEDEFDSFMDQVDSAPAQEQEAPEPLIEDADSGDDIDLGQFEDEIDETSLDESEELDIPEEVDLEAETEDVVAEADIYIAYGKYGQVEDMLLKALERDSSDENVRLKLLEVYSLKHDVEKFDEHYNILRASASPSVIDRAEKFRENIPNAPEFVGDDSPATDKYTDDFGDSFSSEPDDDISSDMSLDLDLGDLDSDSSSDDGLDIDLPDLDSQGADDALDLDMDLGESDTDLEIDEDDLALDLDLDGGDEAEDDGLDLDLDFDSGSADSKTSDASSDDDLDLDLGDLDEDDFTSDLGDDLDLDLGDDLDLDTTEKSLTREEDLDIGDFSLDLEDDDVGGDSEVGKSKLNLTDDLSADDEGDDADEISLDDLDDLSLDTASDDTEVASDSLDLDDDDDLDLSSLDKELDALTSDMEDLGDLDDIVGGDDEASSSVMEEPVTDFGDLEDELEVDALDSAALDDSNDEAMLDEAVSQVPDTDMDFDMPEVDPDASDDDGDLDFLSDSDETGTKLDLARAYIDMGDQEGARDIIKEILAEGNAQQKEEAQGLLARIEA